MVRTVLVALLLVGTLVGSASAKCAWVLWLTVRSSESTHRTSN
jgi:hypothetical protein